MSSILATHDSRVCAGFVPKDSTELAYLVRSRHPERMRSAAILGLVVLATCSVASGAGRSGLRGAVFRGPTTPVCRAGTPCTAPAAHVVVVFRRNGHAIRARTDARGRYRVLLAPGTWQIALASRRSGLSIAPRQVRVVAGRFRTVRLSIDTGIR